MFCLQDCYCLKETHSGTEIPTPSPFGIGAPAWPCPGRFSGPQRVIGEQTLHSALFACPAPDSCCRMAEPGGEMLLTFKGSDYCVGTAETKDPGA